MKIDGVICLLERVIYEYVGHLRARTPTINVSVATHDLFWFYSYVFLQYLFFILRFEYDAQRKIYSARCYMADYVCKRFEKLTFCKIGTHTYGTTAKRNGLQFQFNLFDQVR